MARANGETFRPEAQLMTVIRIFEEANKNGDYYINLDDEFDDVHIESEWLRKEKTNAAKDDLIKAILKNNPLHASQLIMLRSEKRVNRYQQYLKDIMEASNEEIDQDQKNWMLAHIVQSDNLRIDLEKIRKVSPQNVESIFESYQPKEQDITSRDRNEKRPIAVTRKGAERIMKEMMTQTNQPMPVACSKDYFLNPTKNIKLARLKLRLFESSRALFSPRTNRRQRSEHSMRQTTDDDYDMEPIRRQSTFVADRKISILKSKSFDISPESNDAPAEFRLGKRTKTYDAIITRKPQIGANLMSAHAPPKQQESQEDNSDPPLWRRRPTNKMLGIAKQRLNQVLEAATTEVGQWTFSSNPEVARKRSSHLPSIHQHHTPTPKPSWA